MILAPMIGCHDCSCGENKIVGKNPNLSALHEIVCFCVLSFGPLNEQSLDLMLGQDVQPFSKPSILGINDRR